MPGPQRYHHMNSFPQYRTMSGTALLCFFLTGTMACSENGKIPGFEAKESDSPFRIISVPDALTVEEDIAEEDPWRELTVSSWNLRNFSEYGDSESRLGAMVSVLDGLESDIIFLQELLPTKSGFGKKDEAFDALTSALKGYEGLRGDWQDSDSSVGLVYDSERLNLIEVRELFAENQYAFPRPALLATFADPLYPTHSFGVIVLHLKSYEQDGSGKDRRREACAILNAYLDAQGDKPFLFGGDLNDSPLDSGEDNVFSDTFLAEGAPYRFPTGNFPSESFTFGGMIDGAFTGLFLDHFVLTDSLAAQYGSYALTIFPMTLEEMAPWIPLHSDHLPITIQFSEAL